MEEDWPPFQSLTAQYLSKCLLTAVPMVCSQQSFLLHSSLTGLCCYLEDWISVLQAGAVGIGVLDLGKMAPEGQCGILIQDRDVSS